MDGSNLFAALVVGGGAQQMGGAVHTTILFNPQLKTSRVMIPAIIGLILTFIGTIVTSIGDGPRTADRHFWNNWRVMPIKAEFGDPRKITPASTRRLIWRS